MKKKLVSIRIILAIAAVGFLNSAPVWGGDTASFVNLGFSQDGSIYMFAQYGIQQATLRPWADLFAVDVEKNTFIPGGRLSFVHDSPISAGSDGSGALYRIIAKYASLADRCGVNFLSLGQPLYIGINENNPGDTITFRDFDSGSSYRAVIKPQIEGAGPFLRSSFSIELERTSPNGLKKTWIVGSPAFKRPLVSSYRIRQVLTRSGKESGGTSLIFVIETMKQDDTGAEIRYMVETIKL